jgi:hypothetical protein
MVIPTLNVRSFFLSASILAILLFSACASAPPVSHPMPPEVSLGPDAPTIVFLRLTGPPAAVKGILELDGRELGKVFVRRYATINLSPGRHELRFSFPAWASTPAQTVTLECRPNQKYFLCYDSSMSFGGIIPVGPIVILKMTHGLKLVSEEAAEPYLKTFELAFTHGVKVPSPPVDSIQK